MIAMVSRVCNECGNEFTITYSLGNYKYKIEGNVSRKRTYYCCYTCWKKAIGKLEKGYSNESDT